MAGALAGITVIELAAIGPGPFAGMMLADHGARVIRVERPGQAEPANPDFKDIQGRNREVVTLDIKAPDDLARLRAMVREADAFIEGFRPGVIERLGLGPDVLLPENPRLVIGRITGWGQEGPLAQTAGHDIDYVALSGALHTYGPKGGKPVIPTNTVGDYGGGGMLLAFGLLAGILSARSTGKGQVIDCSMLDGAALVTSMTYALFQSGMWRDERGVNLLDSAAPYYDTYETADGKWLAVGAIEPHFQAQLLGLLGLADDPDFVDLVDETRWPRQKARLEALFRTRSRDEWMMLFDGSDACVAPVLGLAEAPRHSHNRARGTFIEVDGVIQPAPGPRFSVTPAPPIRMKPRPC